MCIRDRASIFTMPVGQKGGVADLITNIMSMNQIPMGEAASQRKIVSQKQEILEKEEKIRYFTMKIHAWRTL